MNGVPFALLAILIMGVVTLLTRAIPFLLFRRGDPPAIIVFLGSAIPPIAMSLLLLSSVAGIPFGVPPHGIPEFVALAAVVVVHLLFRNALLSIFGGTILYMVFVQTDLFLRFFP